MYQPATAASTEAYGAVSVRRRGHDDGSSSSTSPTGTGHHAQQGATASHLQQQRQMYPNQAHGVPAGSSSYTGASYAAGYPTGPPAAAHARPMQPPRYHHNKSTALILLPPLTCLLLFHPTPHPLIAVLFTSLVLYGLDLANTRDGTALGVWLGFAISSITLLSGLWDDASVGLATIVARVSSSILLLFCLACWETLQFQWLHKDTPSFAVAMERMLHSVLPLAASSVMTYHSAIVVVDMLDMGPETAAAACPFVFLLCLAVASSICASADSSFKSASQYEAEAMTHSHDDGARPKKKKSSNIHRAITPPDGAILSLMMLIVPPLIHVLTYRRRIWHALASWDDGLDLVLVLTAPYVVNYLLIISGRIWWSESLPWILRTGTASMTLLGAFVPIAVSTVASIAFQLKYIHPLCETASYYMNGNEAQSTIVTTIYLMLSSLSGIAGVWFYGRKNHNDELLFCEYHEDAFQGILAVSGTFLGLALGMPLRLLPLPALCFLAIAIYVATRMFRYYTVLLFVAFTCFSFFVQYRFLYIQRNVDLLFGIRLSMNQFGMAGLVIGMGVLSVVGLVFRSPDGWGAESLKRLDLSGVVLSTYAFLLIPLEAVLLKTFDSHSTEDGRQPTEASGSYRRYMALMTAAILICISWHLKRSRSIKSLTALATASASAGKILSVIIDIADSNAGHGESTVVVFTMRAFAGAVLLISLFGPYSVMTQSHTKVRAKRSLGPSGKPVKVAPDRTNMIVVGYCGIVLPLVILACIPLVLVPLISGLRNTRFYYSSSPPKTEIIGFASCLWGVATLSTTSHLFPEGGAEAWRKTSALMFILGLGMFFVAPSLPWASDSSSASNEFASISSVGLGLGQGRSGGFGLVSATLATLLALTGPLELRERRGNSGGKDRSHLLRLMLFSILFGCGVAWFVGIQSMGGEPFLSLFMTMTACMPTAFLGTVACVLGYSVESHNFDEVQQIAKLWTGTCPLFLLVASVSTLATDASPPFGLGGWLSTYLVVCSMTALAFTIAVRIRSDKTSVTRALGNLTCISSWLLAIICTYGQFGLAGIGVTSGTVVGIPTSIVVTFAAAPILLLLEGESGETISNRRTYHLAGSGRKALPTFGVNFQSLTRANRFSPPLAGTVLVLLIASLHAVFLRGCAWLAVTRLGRGDSSKGSTDVFSNMYDFLSTVTRAKHKEDVANMARTNVFQSKAVASAAKLAGASMWTSQSMMGPFLHLLGVASVIPSLYVLVADSWSPKQQSSGRILALLPLNLVPLFLCRGIPCLWAAALVGIVGGIAQSIASRQKSYVSHMRM